MKEKKIEITYKELIILIGVAAERVIERTPDINRNNEKAFSEFAADVAFTLCSHFSGREPLDEKAIEICRALHEILL